MSDVRRELEQELKQLEQEAAHAEHALNERVKQGGMWEKSREFYEVMHLEDQVQHVREALRRAQ